MDASDLPLGVVYDMLHRSDAPADDDPRMVTVSRMQHRYGVDTEQARRVAAARAPGREWGQDSTGCAHSPSGGRRRAARPRWSLGSYRAC